MKWSAENFINNWKLIQFDSHLKIPYPTQILKDEKKYEKSMKRTFFISSRVNKIRKK